MGKWTKGPWRIEDDPYFHVRGDDGCVFARDYAPWPNRDLITSAPDLAEAAEEAMIRLPRVMGNLVGADLEDVQTAYAALRAALKRAKGEA